MNIVTPICVALGVLCLYYDATTVMIPDQDVQKTVQRIVDSVRPITIKG